MGLFGRKNKLGESMTPEKAQGGGGGGISSSNSKNNRRSSSSSNKKNGKKKHSRSNSPPSMEYVADYIDTLRTSSDTTTDAAATALRALFTLSENSAQKSNREALVHDAHSAVIPTLLDFLSRSARNSSEQYLALLVLNNVSIPAENKRLIAIEANGAHILARLLCDDVSCHLMAIILVNLTFADADLRRELVSPAAPIQLVDALSYALLVSTLDPVKMEQLHNRQGGSINPNYPRELLQNTLDHLQHLEHTHASSVNDQESAPQFPETARWCLCALKNLTRPNKDSLAAHAVMDAGIVSLLLSIVSTTARRANDGEASSLSINEPSTWDANSLQDAALFTLLNLATVQSARQYLKENDTVHTLSLIADFANNNPNTESSPQWEVEKLQCLKARMALAYLVGGEGHYGQAHSSPSRSYNPPFGQDESVLLIMSSEAEELEELLANTLHQRAKEGPGGYSAATFTVKGVLFAIRCLLTHDLNQSTVMTTRMNIGVRLNALLFKSLAQHAIARVLTIDAEAAEHAAFSLYLLSSFGFHAERPFSTEYYMNTQNNSSNSNSLAERILTSYFHMENITPAGQHAAEQLLLRLPYLQHIPNPVQNDQFVVESTSPSSALAWDYDLDQDLFDASSNIHVEHRLRGTKPMPVIFHRPILRRRAPKKNEVLSWTDRSAVTVFPNTLMAVQALSFGSTKVRHMDAIDDIMIANNIASSANGDKTESYNFLWNWQDAAEQMARLQQSKGKGTGLKGFLNKMKSNSQSPVTGRVGTQADEPFSIFGLKCGPMCASSNDNAVLMDDDTLTTLETTQTNKNRMQSQANQFGNF